MVYGYCRISTKSQSIERQVRNIKELYPEALVLEEVFTGTKIEGREKWNRLYKKIKKGDSIAKIADDLVEDEIVISPIYKMVKEYPEDTERDIYQRLN